MEYIPLTANALFRHARQGAYQVSIWATGEQWRPTPESLGMDLQRQK